MAEVSKRKPRRLLLGALIAAALLSVVIPSGVHVMNDPSNPVGASLLQKKALGAMRAKQETDEVKFWEDYGVYGNCYVALYWGLPSFQALCTETIVGVTLDYYTLNTILAYDGTGFYELKNAYRDLKLNLSQIKDIAARHKEKTDFPNDVSEGETYLHPIVLQPKTAWSGVFSDQDSLSSIDVTIDPTFNIHAFALKDFGARLFGKMEAMATPEDQGHWAYRLALREEGKEAVANAIACLSALDYVQAAWPSPRA
jgi:hypothetical protein